MIASPPRAYYNEHSGFAAAWLRNLIDAGHIMAGDVDERSIEDVQPSDLDGYTRCHFFAGIGGWDLALQLAGWPEDAPVFTGSCPCQPFSSAGKRKGFDDERHLWPTWYGLIKECRPPVVFGEQVSGVAGFKWLDAVRADLEDCDYAVAALDLPACSVGAPHRRQRLWWVGGLADCEAGRRGQIDPLDSGRAERSREEGCERPEHGGSPRRVGDTESQRLDGGQDPAGPGRGRGAQDDGGLGNAHGERLQRPAGIGELERIGSRVDGEDPSVRLADHDGAGRGRLEERQRDPEARQQGERWSDAYRRSLGNPWSDLAWIPCADGRARPIPAAQPALFPLAHGIPSRVGILRGAGNAIVPQVAAVFVRSYMDVVGGGDE